MQNIVIKIRESVKPSAWNYCSTKENPADIITRFRPHDLSSNSLWWEGSFFLKGINEETLCTKENLEIVTQKNDAECITEFGRETINKSTTLASISKEVFSIGNVINIEHFSDLGGDYMIPVWRDEISLRPAGTDLTLRLHVEIKFRPGKAGQFSTWHLFRFYAISLNFSL